MNLRLSAHRKENWNRENVNYKEESYYKGKKVVTSKGTTKHQDGP